MDANLALPHKRLEENLKQAGRQAKKNRGRLIVSLCHIATADSDARVSRALDILLEEAAKNNTPKSKGRPETQRLRQSDQASGEEAVTRSKMRTISKGKNKINSNHKNL